jgi:hypothetical protein
VSIGARWRLTTSECTAGTRAGGWLASALVVSKAPPQFLDQSAGQLADREPLLVSHFPIIGGVGEFGSWSFHWSPASCCEIVEAVAAGPSAGFVVPAVGADRAGGHCSRPLAVGPRSLGPVPAVHDPEVTTAMITAGRRRNSGRSPGSAPPSRSALEASYFVRLGSTGFLGIIEWITGPCHLHGRSNSHSTRCS